MNQFKDVFGSQIYGTKGCSYENDDLLLRSFTRKFGKLKTKEKKVGHDTYLSQTLPSTTPTKVFREVMGRDPPPKHFGCTGNYSEITFFGRKYNNKCLFIACKDGILKSNYFNKIQNLKNASDNKKLGHFAIILNSKLKDWRKNTLQEIGDWSGENHGLFHHFVMNCHHEGSCIVDILEDTVIYCSYSNGVLVLYKDDGKIEMKFCKNDDIKPEEHWKHFYKPNYIVIYYTKEPIEHFSKLNYTIDKFEDFKKLIRDSIENKSLEICRKENTDEEKKVWSCSKCTFENNDYLNYCEMCHTEKKQNKSLETCQKEYTEEEKNGWSCSKCTFKNNDYLNYCEMCRTEKKKLQKQNKSNLFKTQKREAGPWECSYCKHFNNDLLHKCKICERHNNLNQKWTCSNCSFENTEFNNMCKECYYLR